MRTLCSIGCALVLWGCVPWGFHRADEIVTRPVSSWSNRDCLTVILAAMQHNYNDPAKPPIAACVTPYTPSVVLALNRMSQLKYRWSGDELEDHTDILLKDAVGMFIDWEQEGRLYDAALKPVRDVSQYDSLIFLITLTNRTWPCTPPAILTADNRFGMQTPDFMRFENWPCETPDISDLESSVWLVNEVGDTVKPNYIWGRRANQLTLDETVLVMFPLHSGARHLLGSSDRVTLELACLKPSVRLTFPIASLR